MAIAPLGRHQIIIGKGWLKRHGALVDVDLEEVIFKTGHCQHPGAVYQTPDVEEQASKTPIETLKPREKKAKVPAAMPTKILKKPLVTPDLKKPSSSQQPEKKKMSIRQIGAELYRYLGKQKGNECFTISFKDIQKAIEVCDAAP